MTKKDFALGIFRFIETRFFIVLIAAVCYSIFPSRGEIYHEKSIHDVIDIRHAWDKFDSYWYQKLAKEGYPRRPFTNNVQETWGYMPLYSLIIGLLSFLFKSDLFYTGIFVSNCCTLAALYFVYKFVQEKYKTGLETISILMLCAGSFYLSIVYSEGLFVLLTALVFYLSYKSKYGWALIFAGLASVTRIQGCLLFVIPLIEVGRVDIRNSAKLIPAFLLSLLPMLFLMFYLYKTCGEPLAFLRIQNAWGSASTYPLQGFLSLFNSGFPGFSIINSLFWVLILGIVLSCYRKMPISYTVFTILYFLLSTSNELVYGTTRYMVGVLPLFIAVSLSRNFVKRTFFVLNILFLAITICAFVTNTATFI